MYPVKVRDVCPMFPVKRCVILRMIFLPLVTELGGDVGIMEKCAVSIISFRTFRLIKRTFQEFLVMPGWVKHTLSGLITISQWLSGMAVYLF